MFVRGCLLAAVAAPALAFSPMAGAPALRSPAAAMSPAARVRPALGLRMSEDEEPKVIFDANKGWVPEHHKQGVEQTGNVDVGDYFEEDQGTGGSTGFKSGAAATGGDGGNRLESLLSASNTEVRQVEKYVQPTGAVEFKPHAWRIDGDFASDQKYDLSYNTAQ
ncbi:hypothetical protein T484DRAFT_1774984, partial [Baffinella frigidus]